MEAGLTELADRGVQAVAVDLPLHGQARSHARARTTLADYDRFLAVAIRHYDAGSGVWLAGNSLGGLLALRAAATQDLPVRGALALGAPDGTLHPLLGTLPVSSRILEPLLRLPLPSAALGRAVAIGYDRLGCDGSLDPQAIARYRGHLDRRRLQELVRAGGTVVAELRGEAAELDAKPGVKVIRRWGERDVVCPPSAARHGAGEVVPDLALCSQVQAPRWCADQVMLLLRETIPQRRRLKTRRIG